MTSDIVEQQVNTLNIAAVRGQPRVKLKSRRSGGWYLPGVTTGDFEIEAR
jgi:hypothetical protein